MAQLFCWFLFKSASSSVDGVPIQSTVLQRVWWAVKLNWHRPDNLCVVFVGSEEWGADPCNNVLIVNKKHEIKTLRRVTQKKSEKVKLFSKIELWFVLSTFDPRRELTVQLFHFYWRKILWAWFWGRQRSCVPVNCDFSLFSPTKNSRICLILFFFIYFISLAKLFRFNNWQWRGI